MGWKKKSTGSSEFQIASLTEKITNLTLHLGKNKKDFSSKEGMLRNTNKRKRLLKYLLKNNPSSCAEIKKSLGIRK